MTSLTGKGPMGQKTPKINKTCNRQMTSRNKRIAEASPLRQNAKGKDCTLRLPGCRNDPAYTVLAHYRRFGWGSMARKPHDLLACFACDRCHDKQERRHPDATDADLLRALGETLMMQVNDGLVRIGGD